MKLLFQVAQPGPRHCNFPAAHIENGEFVPHLLTLIGAAHSLGRETLPQGVQVFPFRLHIRGFGGVGSCQGSHGRPARKIEGRITGGRQPGIHRSFGQQIVPFIGQIRCPATGMPGHSGKQQLPEILHRRSAQTADSRIRLKLDQRRIKAEHPPAARILQKCSMGLSGVASEVDSGRAAEFPGQLAVALISRTVARIQQTGIGMIQGQGTLL